MKFKSNLLLLSIIILMIGVFNPILAQKVHQESTGFDLPIPGTGGPSEPEDCITPMMVSDITFLAVNWNQVVVSWTHYDDIDCYAVQLLVDDIFPDYLATPGFNPLTTANPPVYFGSQEINANSALTLAQWLGLPPGTAAWVFNFSVNSSGPSISANNNVNPFYFVAVAFAGYSGECPTQEELNCPGGGPTLLTSAISCFDTAIIEATCGSFSEIQNNEEMILWLNCVADLQCSITNIGKRNGDEKDLSIPFDLYPNPTQSSLNLKFSNAEEGFLEIRILNADGQKVRQVLKQKGYPSGQFDLSFDVSNLPTGTFIVQIITNTDSQLMKFVKI